MNTLLLKKEIRLLLPSFIVAIAIAFSVLLLTDDPNLSVFQALVFVLPIILCPAILLMMALDSFGREISAGTFSNLLSQPISRSRIWWTKTLLLAAAFLLIWMTWWFLFINNKNIVLSPKELREAFISSILIPVVIFSGGLWTVLLLRQVAAAFWFTLLIPAAITLPIVSFAEKFPKLIEPMLVIVFGVYSIAGFIFARWLFLRAQDVQWTGGNIALPEFRRLGKVKTSSRVDSVRRPRAALVFKELQLHQSQFVMAGVLAVFHLAVILARKFIGTFGSAAVEFVYFHFWVLWFVMPLLIGCAAVAEERKLGTLESQLCLPVRRRTQFFMKLFFALLFSVTLSLAMPLLFEGTRILPSIEIKALNDLSNNFPHDPFILGLIKNLRFVGQLLTLLLPLGIVAVTAMISFYASTLSRNTLQSLAPAVLGILVTFMMLVASAEAQRIFPFPLWRGWLIYLIGVPVMTLTLLGLMYWNFKRVLIGWKTWQRNAVVFVASLAFVIGITTAIYHRVWELLAPIEPAHGAARLASPASVKMQSFGNGITIQFPDGTVWSTIFEPSAPTLGTMLSGNWKIKPLFGGGKFLEGTNWASVAVDYSSAIGIQKDGSLWVPEKPRIRPSTATPKLMRLGQDDDWKQVRGHFQWAFLLKQDGSLWRLSTKEWNRKKPWPGIEAFDLQRLGTNDDWAEILQLEWNTVFRKTDGRTWMQGSRSDTNNIKLDEEISLARAERFDGLKSGSSFYIDGRSFQLGVGEDGKLVAAVLGYPLRQKQQIQIGQESNWLALAGSGETAVTLKADGSLWKWNFADDPFTNPNAATAVRLSKHSDWIAIADEFGSVISLAGDGSLWVWQFDSRYFPQLGIPPSLGASRKPQKIGNIFDASRVP
ncbi:MAG: hypothetical protein ABI042_01185 [Verrucomicrobiota bacterium]